MSLDVKDLNENERDYFEERAAIMEEGNKGMSRWEADKRALEEVERKRKLF
jgi:hypothetical protein